MKWLVMNADLTVIKKDLTEEKAVKLAEIKNKEKSYFIHHKDSYITESDELCSNINSAKIFFTKKEAQNVINRLQSLYHNTLKIGFFFKDETWEAVCV